MDPETPPPSDPTLDTPASEVSSGGSTVEEVEEYWRKRMAGKERAWNAEASVLRTQSESLQQKLTATPAADGEVTYAAGEVAELQRQLADERAARIVDQRKLKFPALAATNPGDAVFAAADEATLAKLNVLAEDGTSGTLIAPTSPRRAAPTSAKRLEDMETPELQAALKAAGDQMDAARLNH